LTSPLPKVSIAKLLFPDVPQSHVEQSGYVIIGRLKDGNLNFLILLNNIVSVDAAANQAIALAIIGAKSTNAAPNVAAPTRLVPAAVITSLVPLTIDRVINPSNITGAKVFHKNLTI
jgi:hypothetical protein